MKFINTEIEGVKIIESNLFEDNRGAFLKIFNEDVFKENGIEFEIKESYYSTSNKDVIRGMHFQLPPYDHDKLVNVISGKIIDIILDLRQKSNTYRKYISIELSADNNRAVFIPRGCAHGFKSIVDNTIVMYNVSTVYNNKFDSGVRWDSFGFEWEVDKPIVSDRDNSFKKLCDIEEIF